MDAGICSLYVVEETVEPGENNRPRTGHHYPAIGLYLGSEQQQWKASVLPLRYPGP